MGQKTSYKSGHMFGKIMFIRDLEGGVNRRAAFLCPCGKEFENYIGSVKQGLTKSCGCQYFRKRIWQTVEYHCWRSIQARCFNEKNASYENYGRRGITVSEEWLSSFDVFLKDMGKRPGKGYSIERIDNDKGYSKDNCKWATWSEQAKNKRPMSSYIPKNKHRKAKRYLYKGESLSIPEWSRKLGMSISTLRRRIFDSNWSQKDALELPPSLRNKQIRKN
jgi:hypothetical protein